MILNPVIGGGGKGTATIELSTVWLDGHFYVWYQQNGEVKGPELGFVTMNGATISADIGSLIGIEGNGTRVSGVECTSGNVLSFVTSGQNSIGQTKYSGLFSVTQSGSIKTT